jgi:hypothetical protein
MAAFEFGNLGADVVAPLEQQIAVRDFLLRRLSGVGAEGRKFLYAFPDPRSAQRTAYRVSQSDLIHYCSPKLKKAQRGVGPSKRCDTIRHVELQFTPGRHEYHL